jgi:hypothetical protein
MAVLVGLNAIRECRQGGVSQYFLPTCKIKLGLRIQIRQLDGDRHAGKYSRKGGTKCGKTGLYAMITALRLPSHEATLFTQ